MVEAVTRDKRVVMPDKVVLSPTVEILDRLRRIETRLCNLIEEQGGTVKGMKKPEWISNGVNIHSMDTRLSDILAARPPGSTTYVAIRHEGVLIAMVDVNA